MLNNIIEKNPDYKFYSTDDYEFRKYGKVLKDHNFEELIRKAEQIIEMPEKGIEYSRSVADLELLPQKTIIENMLYGSFTVQIGCCKGYNSVLNALEYHKSNETIIPLTDLILILGHIDDISKNTFNIDLTELFYIPEGTAIELFSTTLHFNPVSVDEYGFKSLIILPEKTNAPLDNKINPVCDEYRLLWMKNKWLLAHENSPEAEQGAHIGLYGEEITITY
jgi:hypothetical protein